MGLVMKSNWKRVSDLSFGHEGGFTANPKDRGNWTTGVIGQGQLKGTKFGISAMSYPKLDIKNLTRDQALLIYKRDFWDKIGGDSLPVGVDYSTFDYALNSGVGRAVKDLQRALQLEQVDGIVGVKTLQAMQYLSQKQFEAIIVELNNRRLTYMRGLKTWGEFGKGWKTRVDRVKAISLSMATSRPTGEMPALPSTGTAKARAEDTKVLSSTEAKTTAGTVIAPGGGVTIIEGVETAAEHIDIIRAQVEPFSYYLEWAQYACVGLMIVGGVLTIYLAIKRKRKGG